MDACVSPVLELNEAPLHNHNKTRNSFVKLQDGTYLPSMNWLNMKDTERSFEMPKVGEHTQSILKDLGYSTKEIEEFVQDNVVEQESSNLKAKL